MFSGGASADRREDVEKFDDEKIGIFRLINGRTAICSFCMFKG